MISTLARHQHGVVARWQLLAAGVTRHQIALRLSTGRLHERHRGVYLVGHDIPPPYALETAAVLACRGAGVISHESSTALWELTPYPAPVPVQVTVPPAQRLERLKLTIHRAELAPRHPASPRPPPHQPATSDPGAGRFAGARGA